MAAPSTISEFLDVVRRSRQVNDSALDTYLEGSLLEESLSPRKLAVKLIQAGVMTAFQAEQFLQGKYKGFQLAGYRILDRLGIGGTGLVYLAEHEVIRKQVALKVLPPAFAQDPQILERFRHEARAAAALDHPNVVHVYDFRQDGPIHFIVMEYVEGPTLQQLLKRRKRLSVSTACEYARQTAIALHHAHTLGLVHRDVKPANLIVDAAGTVKVLDLGLALFEPEPTQEDRRKGSPSQVLGTADYLAPEQALNLHEVDCRADVYSLGATLYALLVGHPPFPNCSIHVKLMKHQVSEPTPVHELRSDVPEALSRLVSRMLAKKPDDRPESAAQVALDLEYWSALPTCEAFQPSSQTMIDIRRSSLSGVMRDSSGADGVRPQSTDVMHNAQDDTISLASSGRTPLREIANLETLAYSTTPTPPQGAPPTGTVATRPRISWLLGVAFLLLFFVLGAILSATVVTLFLLK